jgi:hypothetical protein
MMLVAVATRTFLTTLTRDARISCRASCPRSMKLVAVATWAFLTALVKAARISLRTEYPLRSVIMVLVATWARLCSSDFRRRIFHHRNGVLVKVELSNILLYRYLALKKYTGISASATTNALAVWMCAVS